MFYESLNFEKTIFLDRKLYIPNRLYQNWGTRVLDIEAPRLDEYETTESAEKLVLEMLTQLLKLGLYLSKHQKVCLIQGFLC